MTTPTTKDLFQSMVASGELSPGSGTLLGDLGDRLDAANPEIPADARAVRKTLVGLLIDNTPSMREAGNDAQAVDGQNFLVDELSKAKTANSIEAYCSVIHPGADYVRSVTGGSDIFQWGPISGAPRLLMPGFIQGYDTPLYQRVFESLGLLMARAKYWEEEFSVATRGIFGVVTDAGDNAAGWGGNVGADEVREVVEQMLASEKYVLRFYGLESSGVDDYTDIGLSMGFPRDWIRTVPSDGKALRAEFELFSQTSKDFSATADPADFTDFDDEEEDDDLDDVDFDDDED